MTQPTAALDREPSYAQKQTDQENILRIVEKHQEDRGGCIAVLGEIQSRYGYLSEEALRTVSEAMGLSLVDIYGVATFYRSFSLQPRGKHLVSVCLGTACHVRGARLVVEEFQRQLGIKPGETTPDKEFTLETVNCLGACALGPIVVTNGYYSSNVTPTQVKKILSRARQEPTQVEDSLAKASYS